MPSTLVEHTGVLGGREMRRWALEGVTKHWFFVVVGSLIVGWLMTGCATGMPGSPVRSFYNLCMRETQDTTYCEAWANSRGLGGQVGVQMIVPFPGR